MNTSSNVYLFKCRLCGNIFEGSQTHDESAQVTIMKLSGEMTLDGEEYFAWHNCRNGSVGISEIIGAKPIKELR